MMMRRSSSLVGHRNIPRRDPVALLVHVNQLPAHGDAQKIVETAVHNYFAYRAKLNRLEFRHLLKEGRTSLIIGLIFLGACLFTSEFVTPQQGSLSIIARESLTIAGWVAMWRPIRIFLYDWWPVLRRGRLYEKLSRMRVEVRKTRRSARLTLIWSELELSDHQRSKR